MDRGSSAWCEEKLIDVRLGVDHGLVADMHAVRSARNFAQAGTVGAVIGRGANSIGTEPGGTLIVPIQ